MRFTVHEMDYLDPVIKASVTRLLMEHVEDYKHINIKVARKGLKGSSAITVVRSYDVGQVYSIVSTTGVRKQHRFYKIKPLGTLCEMSDGKQTLVVPTEMLFAAVFGLCGIDPATADQMRPSFEETLNAAVAG